MAKLEEIRKKFKHCQTVYANQKQREIADLKFQIPELQWDENARRQRQGGQIGGEVIPARPTLSIDKIDQPMQLVKNQAHAAKLGVNIHPISEDASKDVAEIKQGLYRRIERDSQAQHARLWAFERAVIAGMGAYRVGTKWDEDSDPKFFDQEITIERILYQDMVYFDPSATKRDFSDGDYVFVGGWMTQEQYAREFPGKKLDFSDDLEWENLEREAPEWVKDEQGTKAVLVMEYWYKKHDYQEIESLPGPDGKTRKRTKDVVSVYCCKVNAKEVISEEEWHGRLIPIVPMIGRELQPFNAERYWIGMVFKAKDGQRTYNYAASSLVEGMSLEPKSPFIGVEGQFEGHEAKWNSANVRNWAYLEYKPTGLSDGSPAPAPQRSQVDTSKMQLAIMAMQEADNFVQTSTSIYDPSLGRENPRDKSGKAIVALQQQSDAGTSHFLSELADVSMAYEARVVLDLMPYVYDRPGRQTTIVRGDDEKSEPVMLNAPFVKGQDEQPQQAEPGIQGAKEYDLRKGNYGISIDVGKSYQTRLQQGQEELGSMLGQLPPELQVLLLPTYMRFRDTPGAKEVAKILTKFRDQKFPGLNDEGEEPTPEQIQAENQALKGQMQQMQQALQEMQKALETEQVKAQATLQGKQLDAASREKIASEGNEVKILLAKIQAEVDGIKLQLEQGHETVRDREEMAHETGIELVRTMGKIHDEKPEKGDVTTELDDQEGE